MKHVVCLLLIVFLAGPSLGATISLEGDGRTYYVAVSDPSAECLIEELGKAGVKTARCAAGDRFVTATVEWGCGESFGPTYCGSVNPEGKTLVANELQCSHRGPYVLVGGSGDVRCEREDQAMRCRSPGGNDLAEASCASGCGEVRGAGVCCIAGTTGCPPGLETTEAE